MVFGPIGCIEKLMCLPFGKEKHKACKKPGCVLLSVKHNPLFSLRKLVFFSIAIAARLIGTIIGPFIIKKREMFLANKH